VLCFVPRAVPKRFVLRISLSSVFTTTAKSIGYRQESIQFP
jgi:hypothetical protein